MMLSTRIFNVESPSSLPVRVTAWATSAIILATAGIHILPRVFPSLRCHRNKPKRMIRFLDHKGNERVGEYIEGDDKHAYKIVGDIYGDSAHVTSCRLPVVTLLSPIEPTYIMCTGLNYKSHVEESDMKLPKNPVLFTKLPGVTTAHEANIVIPAVCEYKQQIDYEGELCVVLSRDAFNVSEEDALDYVLGYTIGNDVSARDWQLNGEKSGSQWIRGKSFDTFAPLGPYLLLASSFSSRAAHASFISNLRIRTTLNGQTMQDGNTKNMLFNVAKLISFFSEGTTLPKGTVIMTGTPEGVGFARNPPVWMNPGDEISIEITGLGKLTNYVVKSCCAGKK